MTGGSRRFGSSLRVALGTLSSRVFGLMRESVLAACFGLGAHADVLAAVFRGPNLLQNLLGGQTLSASVIPIYSRMLEAGRRDEAGRFAGAVFGLLLAAGAGVSLIGILFAPQIVALLTPGFVGDAAEVAAGTATVDRFALAVPAVRIVFPMAALLLLSAWSLAILNSHRRFFLSYFAPVLWNVAIITAVVSGALLLAPDDASGAPLRDRLLTLACVGGLVGGLLQFGVQLPLVLRLARGLRVSFSLRVKGIRRALTAFGPLVAARGAAQVSAYLDQVLASLLVAGAVAGLRWAYILYLLPFALFAGSVAAAELPELARRSADAGAELTRRGRAALAQVAFLVVPTVMGYLVFGYLIAGAVYQRGEYGSQDNWLVYLVLAGYTLGLLAASWVRLLQNIFYALEETRTPARIAVVRMAVSALVGAGLMLWLDRYSVSSVVGLPGERLFLGAVGLAVASGLSGWLELWLLRRALARRFEEFELPWVELRRPLAWAFLALLPAGAVALLTAALPLVLRGPLVVLLYAGIYMLLARWRRAPELEAWLGRRPERRSGGDHE